MEIAAPFIPPIYPSNGIKILFNIYLITTDKVIEMRGILLFPIPIRTPLSVCSIAIKIIEKELILRIAAPLDALGNNNFNIASDWNTKIATVGSAIRSPISKEILILFSTSDIFPLDFAAAILGIRAVDRVPLNDNGKFIKVSTLPFKIPYCIFAFS